MQLVTMMRAIDIRNGSGPATALYCNDAVERPTPGEGEALIKIKAFGLNRMDLLQREGQYPVPPQASRILGVEYSGIIESLGNVTSSTFKPGDEVFGLAYGGAYAEFIVVRTEMLIHKPETLSWTECAGMPETWITALQALHVVGGFQQGKSVLWHAGASSVSISGIQLSRLAGASQIFVTAGSQDKIDFCVKSLGATTGFNYHTEDWSQKILDATNGKGVDLVIDFIGQSYFQGNLNVAAMDGRIVQLGTMSGVKLPGNVDIGAFVRKRVRFEGTTLRSRDLQYQKKLRDTLEEHLDAFAKGKLKVFVDTVLPWEKIVEAHQKLESNTTTGKIICTID